ncbi:nitrate/nitrite two-component system sensor histidine kinase NarX [Simiduia litorea]|uniref:ATP-binding protein n=1 Tax=Simiduia litorea TaxID=1435348 RepID=UPI0036F1BABA
MIEGLKRQFGQSVMNTITLSLAAIMAVSLLSIFTTYWITELGDKDAQAINLSGTLRMQTYRIALSISQDDDQSAQRQIEELRQTWRFPLLVHLKDADISAAVSSRYEQASQHWQTIIEPQLAWAMALPYDEVRPAIAQLIPALDQQIALTNALVSEFQQSAEERIIRLRLIQIVGFFTIVCVGSLAFYFTRERIEKPLKELTSAADKYRQGNLSHRLHLEGRDEFALLAEIFNLMGESIQANYAELEARVDKRTEDLKRQTKALEFLLSTSRQIMSAYHQPVDHKAIINELAKLIDHADIDICLFTQDGSQPYYHVGNNGTPDCSEKSCSECKSEVISGCYKDPFEYQYNIGRDDRQYGILSVREPLKLDHSHWADQLITSTADQLALALSLADQKALDRKVATLDERTVIARELHDSLAQALSYLKIQVVRLQKTCDKQEYDKQQPIVNELREGLSSAYRQLRELLTTFRLKLDSSGLEGALIQTVNQLRERSEMNISLNYKLTDIPLTPAEEIHLMQIVREAAQNALHHSKGTELVIDLVHLIDDHILLMVSDNGIGLPSAPEKLNHYGLAIMKERSRSLNGEFHLGKGEGRGTKITFKFKPDYANLKQAS